MSWIIHPSYQPLSLLMTNNGEISVKTSIKALGSLGSVGSSAWAPATTRTAPTVGESTIRPGGSQLHVGIIHSRELWR